MFKEKVKEIGTKVSAFGALAVARANYLVRSDAFVEATNATKALTNKLKDLANVIFPLAVVICAISMFFTRDQKKFDVEKKILIGCCLAYALIIIATKAGFTDTITTLFN